SVKDDSENLWFSNNNEWDQKALILDSLLSADSDTLLLADLQILVDSLQIEEKEEGNFISVGDEEFEEGGFWDYVQEHAQKANNDPDSFYRSSFRVASISLFFLLPIFALVLWGFHFKRNSFYVQHLVHALHLHTFVFALLSTYLFISFWIEAETSAIITLVLLVYFIWSLKVVYSQKVLPSITKAISILIVYFIIFLLALVPGILIAIVTV
ncbi:MAG: hypothetical protein ACI9A8_002238, partial [Cryomorphaceae bacterium]